MNKNRDIPWSSILKTWLQKPRVVTYSRYSPYLPKRIFEYLKIDDLSIRKERIRWLIGLLANYDMNEINEKFYEFVEQQSNQLREPKYHPFDVDWSKYDQLQSLPKEVIRNEF